MKEKVNILANPYPYIFFTLQIDSARESSAKTYHKFTMFYWQFMAVALFSGHFVLHHGLGTRLV